MKVKSWLSVLLAAIPLITGLAKAQTDPWIDGVTEPYWDVWLSSQSSGMVSTNFYKEGDFVQKGQVILELDKQLETLMVQRRKFVLDTLKTDWEGTRMVYESTKSVSKDDLAKKELEYRVAVVDYETAEEQLRRRQVIAPMDGFVTDLRVRLGEHCRAEEPVVRLVDPRRCYFIGYIQSKGGYSLQPGLKMSLDIEAGTSWFKVEGVITFASPVVDPASGLRKIKVLFDNVEGKIRPGVPGKMQLKPLSNAN